MRNLENLDWNEIVERLQKNATSEVARENLRTIQPLSLPQDAKSSFQEIHEAQNILSLGQRPFMESLDLYSVWFQRLARNAVLKTLELKDVRHFCIETIALDEVLQEFAGPWATSIKDLLLKASEPLSAIDQIMTPGGDIRTDASETLYKLYNEKTSLARNIQTTLDRLVKKHDMEPVLQDRYVTNREGRWVLPVKSGMQGQMEGIIHAASQSKQTVFMEPQEIIPMNNRLRQVEVEIEEEIERLLTQLSHYLHSLKDKFEQTRQALLEADERFAKAQLATQLNAIPCEFTDKEVELTDVRHPLLVLYNEEVIPNSVHLDGHKRILLLSGPNAGGKTVLLKSVGLAAQMARCGLPICAEQGSKLPFFEHIHIAIGDSQSVDAHLSTFAAHLEILNSAARAHGRNHLLLIDEICGSTDPEEGTALARSFIESYAQNDVFGVVTSHLGPLKLGWSEDSGVINGSLEYDAESGRPTYQFFMGIPGQSLAIQTAKRVGVAPEIVERAVTHLSPELRHYQEGLEQVEDMKADLRQLREQLQKEQKESRKAKSKYEAMALRFEKDREKMIDQALKEAEKKVEQLIDQAKVSDTFRKHEQLEKMKSQLPKVVKASPKTTTSTIDSAEEFSKRYPPGSKVYVPSIGRDAVIQGNPNMKGEIPILSNSMRLMVHWENLKPAHQSSNPTAEIVRKTQHFTTASPAESDRVVDLRGQTVDEALAQLDIQLDTAAINQEERLKVIHGHGTEALKKSIRTYLSRSTYVKRWKAGGAHTGGDGVTWVEIHTA